MRSARCKSFALALHDERIGLHPAGRADAVGSGEQDARREMLDRVALERGEDDVVLAVDGASGHGDARARCGEEVGGDRKRVRQDVELDVLEELDEAPRRRAGIDDDAVAGLDEPGRRARDRPLFRDADLRIDRERNAGEMGVMPGPQGLGAAPDAPHLAAVGERRDVAPDRRLGGVEQFDEIADAHDGALLDELQDEAVAFPLQHGHLPVAFQSDHFNSSRLSTQKRRF